MIVKTKTAHLHVHDTRHNDGKTKQDGRHSDRDVRNTSNSVGSMCTQICGGQLTEFIGKSCSKTLLVKVFPKKDFQQVIAMDAVKYDQSNRSLVSPNFFYLFKLQITRQFTLSHHVELRFILLEGRWVCCSQDKSCSLDIPTLTECENIPNV